MIRIVAQIAIEQSNSMIEMLFHRLKHRHLFTIPLTNFVVLVKAVDFYLTDSNIFIPQSALDGATPEEAMRTRTNRGGSPSSPNKVRLFYRQSAAVSFFVRLKNT